jgi:predicted phosphohydrolase
MPAVYGLADPHLGRSINHSMAEYGRPWWGHPQTLFERWDATVPENAFVLVPGDISIAKHREDILSDYADVEARTGALKILSPGNHDDSTIWATQGKVRAAIAHYPSLLAIKGQAERFAVDEGTPGFVVAATRGSLTPGSERYEDAPERAKQYEHETSRLALALERARALMQTDDKLVVALHYPPFHRLNEDSVYTRLIEDAGRELVRLRPHSHRSRARTRVPGRARWLRLPFNRG